MDNPIVFSFNAKVSPKMDRLTREQANEALNTYWYGEPLIPLDVYEYPNSELHLKATYNLVSGRTLTVRYDIYADGSWKLNPI